LRLCGRQWREAQSTTNFSSGPPICSRHHPVGTCKVGSTISPSPTQCSVSAASGDSVSLTPRSCPWWLTAIPTPDHRSGREGSRHHPQADTGVGRGGGGAERPAWRPRVPAPVDTHHGQSATARLPLLTLALFRAGRLATELNGPTSAERRLARAPLRRQALRKSLVAATLLVIWNASSALARATPAGSDQLWTSSGASAPK
jgi:hypothetical protein